MAVVEVVVSLVDEVLVEVAAKNDPHDAIEQGFGDGSLLAVLVLAVIAVVV